MKIGVDIGGTKIIAGYRGLDGQLVTSDKIQTPPGQADGIAAIAKLVRGLADGNPISVLSISAPGPMDFAAGLLLSPANLSWGDVAIVTQLQQAFPETTVILENDAKAAALAEYLEGAGQGAKTLLYLTISTGIGTALIIDGHIFHGAHDTEGGRMLLRDSAGHLATLEATVSGSAIKQRFGKLAYEITDPATWQTIGSDLALGLVNMINLISPDRVVLGGGVMVHYDKLEGPMHQALEALVHPYPLPPIVPATHIETAAVLGAILLAEGAGHSA